MTIRKDRLDYASRVRSLRPADKMNKERKYKKSWDRKGPDMTVGAGHDFGDGNEPCIGNDCVALKSGNVWRLEFGQ